MCKVSFFGILGAYIVRLRPGELTEKEFDLFIDLTTIRSESAVCALKDYFVNGYTRGDVCIKHGVSQGYLSLKIKQCQLLNEKLMLLLLAVNNKRLGSRSFFINAVNAR